MKQQHQAQYENPLLSRYTSLEMSHLFSGQFKYTTWRKLWVALAEAERELGLPIQSEQIAELSEHLEDIDFSVVAKYEKQFRHDVMAHIHAYGDQCPKARSIIHLGATSCFVTDNADLIQISHALRFIFAKLLQLIRLLKSFASEYAELPCLAFTHFQPAQLTTVGKRACLWLQDFVSDLEEAVLRMERLKFLGVKGTTGTQASFLALFDQQEEKVEALDQLVAKKMRFSSVFSISGQTYPRKQDAFILGALANIGVSAHKFATDLRLLIHLKEMEEPFEKEQVGSSAMPYKRNPIYSERICSLSRFLISLGENPYYTAATQWLERSLDDSANRRIVIPEAFLSCDAILNLAIHIMKGLQVYPKVVARHVSEELPFMATENVLMASVKKGGDRQALHQKLRDYSHAASAKIKEEGKSPNLLERILEDPSFSLSREELKEILDDKKFIGRAPQQTKAFIEKDVEPLLQKYAQIQAPSFAVEV